jgi:site-specific recombinase XerC
MGIEEKDRFLGESWIYFIGELNGMNSETAKVYLRYMSRYLEETDQTSEEFYNYVIEHLEHEDRRKMKKLSQEFEMFYRALISEKGLHVQTVLNYQNAVLKFLEANMLKSRLQYRVRFNGDMKRVHPESFENMGKDKAESSEIRKLIHYQGEPRNISVIFTMRDTGLRVSDISLLQIKHIQGIIDDPNLEWYSFEITPKKNLKQTTPLKANPVMGPECVEALRRWLEVREEKYGLDKTDPNGYVYCAVYDSLKGTRKGEPVHPTTFSNMIRNTRKKAGISKAISPHSLRKTHSTNLVGAGVPERWVNVMQGRKGIGSQGIYQKPNSEELITVYREAYHALRLDGKSQSDELDELRRQIEKEKAVNVDLGRRLLDLERDRDAQKLINAINKTEEKS